MTNGSAKQYGLPALLASLCVLSACSQRMAEPDNFIRGSITYPATADPGPEAELVVQLLDISLADAPATELATTTITNPGLPPVSYAIQYDPAEIIPARSYAVRATLFAGGKMQFTTDTVHPVLTREAGRQADINLIAVKRPTAGPPATSLTGTRWELSAIEDKALQLSADQPRPFLVLQGKNNAVNGNAGCNSFAGTYTQEEDKLSLGPLAITAMACIDSMDTERAFTTRLAQLDRFEITGNRLRVYNGEELLLVFAAAP